MVCLLFLSEHVAVVPNHNLIEKSIVILAYMALSSLNPRIFQITLLVPDAVIVWPNLAEAKPRLPLAWFILAGPVIGVHGRGPHADIC